MVIARDITERKRAEETLRHSKEYFRSIIENASDVVIIVDKKGTISYASPSIERFSGYKPEELIGKSAFDFIMPADLPRAIIDFGKAILTKETAIPNNFRIRHKDGSERVFDGLGKNLLDNPAIAGFVMNVRDITERKRAEKNLREQKEILQTILDNIPVMIAFLDSDGTHKWVNQAWEKNLGWSLAETQSCDVLKELYPDPEYYQYVVDFISKAESRWGDFRTRRRDGTVLDTTWTNVLLFDGSNIGIGMDITERKRAEEALKESEEKFRTLAESAQCGITILQGEKTLYNNPAVTSYTGYTEEELEHMNFWDMVRPDFKELVKERGLSRQEGKPVPARYEIPIITKSGEERWIDISVGACELNGKPAVISTAFDITERKRAETALEKSEKKYRTLVETAQEGIGIVDRDENVVFTNQAYADLLGYNKDELVGLNLSQISDKEEFAKFRKETQKRQQGESSRYETKLYTKTGEPKYFSISATPLHDDRGAFTETLGLLTDITERKRGEEALKESEEKYKFLFEESQAVNLVVGMDGKIIDINKSTLELLGYDKKDVMGKDTIEFIVPEQRETVGEQLARDIEGEQTPQVQVDIMGKEGIHTFLFAEGHGTILEKGRPTGILISALNITEKKKMEAQLIQTERLSAVGTLAYGIAHEFNNILAGILGNAEFGMGNDDPQEMKECFQIIMESCDRAKSITNSLLAFSRQRETKKQRADVTSAVETILGLVERELEKHNIKVVRKFNPIPEIVCDLGELSGVVLNMITNARDAMRPKGGTLTIEIEKKRDNIEIIFTDSGCGIPDSIKSRIFEPFVTTKGALGQSEIPGTGLGLFLSYGIIKRYDGEIGVKSEVGKGSTFTIRIPISKNQTEPVLVETEEDKPTAVPQNLNILLVDDEKPICTAIKKFFEAKGHSVTTALSGKKGLKVFKKGEFDLVLADIIMPDMDGVELISKLKEIDKQVKFIVLTGHIAEEKLEKAKKAGADQIMMKPFRNEELYQAIGRVLSI
jgi:PAS domain S-box-containing protein